MRKLNPIHHLTMRFADDAPLMDSEEARTEYLRQLDETLRRVDWRLLSYALMPTYVHLGFEQGEAPMQLLMHPVHAGFETWLRHRGVRGDVWAPRFDQIVGATAEFAVHMIAFQHNATVRAGCGTTAWDSPWTSHRSYILLAPRLPSLAVYYGLQVCGFEDDGPGRQAFDELVYRRSVVREEHWLSPEYVVTVEARSKPLLQWSPPEPVEPEDTERDTARLTHDSAIPEPVPREHVLRHAQLDADRLVLLACQLFYVERERLRSTARGDLLTLVRRAIVWAWIRGLGGRQAQIARALGRESNTCGRLLATVERGDDSAIVLANELVARMR